VQIGDVNVRLEDDRFADLAAVIEEAVEKLPSPSVRWKVVRGPAH
jgi:hypothetical protein